MKLYKSLADCCGCSACVSVCPCSAIHMEADREGFAYPHIDQAKCIDCNLCEKVCPISTYGVTETLPGDVIAGHAKDENIWQSSSSGGVFTILAEWVIENGGIVYGAGYDDSMKVRHIAVTDLAELKKLRGSKYVQSDVDGIYSGIKAQLNRGGGNSFCSQERLVRSKVSNAI